MPEGPHTSPAFWDAVVALVAAALGWFAKWAKDRFTSRERRRR